MDELTTMAEQRFLGGIFLEPGEFHELRHQVLPKHFYTEAHQRIYRVMVEVYNGVGDGEYRFPDVTAVSDRLREYGMLLEVGGAGYLAELVQSVENPGKLEGLARIIVAKWKYRELGKIGIRIASEAASETGMPDVIWENGIKALMVLVGLPGDLAHLLLAGKQALDEREKVVYG